MSTKAKKPAPQTTKVAKGPVATVVDAILADIAAGEPAYKAAQAHGVKHPTFWLWVSKDPALADKYARAKSAGMERMAEEIVQIADEVRRGVKTTTKADGSVETVDGDMVERARLQIDSRKWLLSKLLPKKYGEKLDVAHSGGIKMVTINESDRGLL